MRSRLFRSAGAALLAGAAAAGCAAPKFDHVRAYSKDTWASFDAAHDAWRELHRAPLDDAARGERFQDVAAALEALTREHPDSPLFHAKHGELLLETGNLEAARRAFDRAAALCPDWVPAWLGLADVALAAVPADAPALALVPRFLDEAEAAIERWPEPLEAAETREFGSADLSEAERGSLYVQQLARSLAWQRSEPRGAPAAPFASDSAALRGIEARCEYRRLLFRFRREELNPASLPAAAISEEFVLQVKQRILALDPDYLEPRLELSRVLRRLGRPLEAAHYLDQLLRRADAFDRENPEPEYPLLGRDPALLAEAADVWTDEWIRAAAVPELAQRANLETIYRNHVAYAERLQLDFPQYLPYLEVEARFSAALAETFAAKGEHALARGHLESARAYLREVEAARRAGSRAAGGGR